jgi:rhodanese-related sulfurtransferase
MDMALMAPRAVREMQAQGRKLQLIDVRTPVEYREVHAEGARNVPLDTLDPATLPREPDALVVVICRSGSRGKRACEKLLAAGWQNVVNVEGGTQAWEAAGLPVQRGPKMMSLERQVRIAAGSLVLLGLGLAWFHPIFLALSAFVGAGLVFAGVTDTCGMGMLLARMPWNRVEAPCCSVK